MSEVFEIALDSGARSQIAVLIRNYERMATDAFSRDSHAYAVLVCDDLVRWLRRLNDPLSEQLVTEIIKSIRRICSRASEVDDRDAFRHCFLDLGKIGEILGQRYAREVGLHILDRNLPDSIEEAPSDALTNAVYALISARTGHGERVPDDFVVLCDVLYICTLSFMESPAFDRDEQAAKLSRHFFDMLADLALTAAKAANGDVTWKVIYDMGQLADHPSFLAAKELCESLAWNAFHLGMLTEAKAGTFTHERGIGDEARIARDVLALCTRCPAGLLRDAVSGMYERGHTMYIPDAAQKAFLNRLESAVGQKLTMY